MSGPLGNPRRQPVDPVHVLAELSVRLMHEGHTPGPKYNAAAAIAAMTSLLGLMDIPTVDTTAPRRVARRLAHTGTTRPAAEGAATELDGQLALDASDLGVTS